MRTCLLLFGLLLASGMSGKLNAAAPSPVTWRNSQDGMEFVWIPAGSFEAVVASSEPAIEATRAVTVTFTEGFWMGRYEVTVSQFRRFTAETGHVTDAEKTGHRWTWRHPGFAQTSRHPVVYLTYADAWAYARWAGVQLPTQAQWLYACRGGSTRRFPWGDELNEEFLWYRGNTQGTGTRSVGRKLPNRWGLYDTVGNAWEYCQVDRTVCWVQMGASWTRCETYLTRTGDWTGNLIAAAVAPQLTRCDPYPKYPSAPWDDDRGFRCVARAGDVKQPALRR